MSVEELDELEADRQQLHEYIIRKLDRRDYHAVADAAMDLREIQAKVDLLLALARREA